MDAADHAQQTEEVHELVTRKRHAVLTPCGRCHFCNEALDDGSRLFCDNAEGEDRGCAGDWELQRKAWERNGHGEPA